MYRPPNWDYPQGTWWHKPEVSFEAGADALLEGLKKEGVFTYGHHTPDIPLDNCPSESGYWVFIPD